MTKTRKSILLPKHLTYIAEHIRAFSSSIHHLSSTPISTGMTFLVIGIVLSLPLGLSVLLKNAKEIGKNLHNSAQMTLYLQPDISSQQISDLRRLLTQDGAIQNIQYISPEQGLKELEEEMGISNAIKELDENPLPGVFLVLPDASIKTTASAKTLINRLQKLPGVDHAVLNMEWLQRLQALLEIGNRFVYTALILFGLALLLIIGNTMRLTIQKHEREITLTKLLGAKNSFIRRPFLYSGILYGLMGAIIAWLLIDLSAWFISPSIQRWAALYETHFDLKGLTFNSTLILLLSGIILGYLGANLTVNKLIKTIEPKSD